MFHCESSINREYNKRVHLKKQSQLDSGKINGTTATATTHLHLYIWETSTAEEKQKHTTKKQGNIRSAWRKKVDYSNCLCIKNIIKINKWPVKEGEIEQ